MTLLQHDTHALPGLLDTACQVQQRHKAEGRCRHGYPGRWLLFSGYAPAMGSGGVGDDPLELGQRIVAVLEMGRRTATYKLATLMALVDHCVENYPQDPSAPLTVSIADLAERVIELYWRQVEPLLDYGVLHQSTQARERIPAAVIRLKQECIARQIRSAPMTKERASPAYQEAVRDVTLTLAQQPIHRLQKVTGQAGSDAFLYDDSWLSDQVTRKTLATRGNAICLFPGVAHGLGRLSGLLKPTLEILWIDDVTRMNAALRDSRALDLAGHLFGHERVALDRVREAFFDSWGARCFYCAAPLTADSPVDHVLPWSRVGIDGLANLVTACPACNSAKSNSLPALTLVARAVARDQAALTSIGVELGWPVQLGRTIRAARGLYLASPLGSPTWFLRGRSIPLDLAMPPPWFSVELA